MSERTAGSAAVVDVEQTREALRQRGRSIVGVFGDTSLPGFGAVLRREGLSFYPGAALGLLLAGSTLPYLALTALTPEISRSLGIPIGTIAAARSLPLLAAAAASMPAAFLTHRRARRAVVCVSAGVASSVVTVAGGWVTSLLGVLAILCLTGLAVGTGNAVQPTLVVDSYPPEVRVRALSVYAAIGAAGGFVAAVSVWLLGDVGLTWRSLFICLGSASLLMAVLAVPLRDPGFGIWDTRPLRASVHEAHGEAAGDDAAPDEDVSLGFWESCRRVLLTPTNRRVFAAFTVLGVLTVPFVTFLAAFLEERWGVTAPGRETFFAAYAFAGVVALLAHARRGERLFRVSPARAIGAAGSLLAVAVLSIAAAAAVPAFAVMVACFLLAGAASALVLPLLIAALLSIVPGEMRPHAQGLVAALLAAGGLGGSLLLTGIQGQYGLRTVMIVLALLGLGDAFLLRRAAALVDADLDRMIGETLEDEELRRIERHGARLPMLACRGIDFSYGQLQVLFDVDFTVNDAEMVALLGVNGAGKSTLLKVVSGIGLPSRGSVRFRGRDITYLDAERRLRVGITQIPGGRAVFAPMTVVENLRTYGYTIGRDKAAVDRAIEHCFEAFPRLGERRNSLAGTLSGGEQQMLGLSKGLMLRPRLLLIDELSLGLAPVIVGQLLEMVRRINADGTAIVLVEQSVNIALNLVEHAYFMERGAMRFDGRAADLLARDDLLRAVFLRGIAATQ